MRRQFHVSRSDGRVVDDSMRTGGSLILGYVLEGVVGCCGLSWSTQQSCGCRRLDSGGVNVVETCIV